MRNEGCRNIFQVYYKNLNGQRYFPLKASLLLGYTANEEMKTAGRGGSSLHGKTQDKDREGYYPPQ